MNADLALLTEAARVAAPQAMRYWRAATEVWEKPDGAGPVSAADLAVDQALSTFLRGARPGYGWLSEEGDDEPERLDRDRVFIIDPIDGTRAFLQGGTSWSLSLAVAEAGIVRAGVVYLPATDRLYAASKDEGALLNGAPIRVSGQAVVDRARILASKPMLDPAHWRDPPPIVREFRPSIAYRLSLVGEGRFDGMLTLRPSWEWDVAAGSLIAAEAGAVVTDRRGQALQFNTPARRTDGLIAAPQGLHAGLLARLA